MKPVIIVKALPHTFVTFLIGVISGVAFSKEGALYPGGKISPSQYMRCYTKVLNGIQHFMAGKIFEREEKVF